MPPPAGSYLRPEGTSSTLQPQLPPALCPVSARCCPHPLHPRAAQHHRRHPAGARAASPAAAGAAAGLFVPLRPAAHAAPWGVRAGQATLLGPRWVSLCPGAQRCPDAVSVPSAAAALAASTRHRGSTRSHCWHQGKWRGKRRSGEQVFLYQLTHVCKDAQNPFPCARRRPLLSPQPPRRQAELLCGSLLLPSAWGSLPSPEGISAAGTGPPSNKPRLPCCQAAPRPLSLPPQPFLPSPPGHAPRPRAADAALAGAPSRGSPQQRRGFISPAPAVAELLLGTRSPP